MSRFDGWKKSLDHAFKVTDGAETLSPEDHQLLERAARFVVKRGMGTVAILFLESVKPLNFVGSSILHFFQPLIGWALTKFEYERFAELLGKRCSIPLLIDKIEQFENENSSKKKVKSSGAECAPNKDQNKTTTGHSGQDSNKQNSNKGETHG